MNKLISACAGAGKTHRIVSEAIQAIDKGERILIITYTINNQKEIYEKYKSLGGNDYKNFKVKGLFTFLLEDIIRPYQNVIFKERIESLIFNERDPHKIGNRTIFGRKEILDNGETNPLHFLTQNGNKAHSTYLSKLAKRIITKTKNAPIKRLENIYNKLYFDEVQDLVGWDYEIIDAISKSKKISLTCVGDFRQTIYQTAITTKKPLSTIEKKQFYIDKNFEMEDISLCRRSILEICELSDTVHSNMGFPPTTSNVKVNDPNIMNHIGAFAVKDSDVNNYITRFNPVLLRSKVTSGKKYAIESLQKFTYGKAKGLGFDRVLILPTKEYISFLCGERDVFNDQKTESSKNKLYVALTRARYSVAIIYPDVIPKNCPLKIWTPE